MAAVYSGIHLKLKSPQTPWEDKVKLARFAWISSQCLMPNKEQVLLDWCTHALTLWYNKKAKFSQEVLEGLWCYLDDVLHSRKLQSLLKQGRTIALKLNIAQLIDHLQEHADVHSKLPVCSSTILSVCLRIFSSPVLSSVFMAKYELMVDLVSKLCSLACRQLQHLTESPITKLVTGKEEPMTECESEPSAKNSRIDSIADILPKQTEFDKASSKPKEDRHSANLFEVLLQLMSCYLSVQKQQANPSRVFTMVTNRLIQPLALLRHLLTCGEFAPCLTRMHVRQQLCRDLRIKLDSILQFALFSSELLTSYKEELLPSKEDSGKRGGTKGSLKPVTAVLCKLSAQGYCEPSLHYAMKSNSLLLLFKFFLEQYGKGRGEVEEEQRVLCFYFLVKLVEVLDLHLDGCSALSAKTEQPESVSTEQESPPDSTSSPENWSLALLAVESLLSQTLSAGIYNVAADRIRHNDVQLNFYRSLGEMLLNKPQPSIPSWYRCLKVLLGLNHLILEPDLDKLLSLVWVNADCKEARVQRARQLMVSSLLQIYTKLRQLPRLFAELLSVIEQTSLDDFCPPLLSEGISTSLMAFLLDTPPSQGLEMCSSVLDTIKNNILPDLKNEKGKAEKMEIDREQADKEREEASLKLLSLTQLLHTILFSLKTLESASPVLLVRQSQGLMKELQQLSTELLNLLTKEKNDLKTTVISAQKTPKKIKKKLHNKGLERFSGALWEQKILEAALLIWYTRVEVDTLFHIHCSKYTSLDSALTAAEGETEDQACSRPPLLSHIESLLSGGPLPDRLHPSPSCSPMSCLVLKLLTLQQMKKVILDNTLQSESSIPALLNRSAQFILAKSELEKSLDEEQVWDGQIGNVNPSSYFVAHWYLLTSNLPLIIPHLSGEDVDCMANVLVSSLLKKQMDSSKDQTPGCLTVSLISSQLLKSPIFAELRPLFSATVRSFTQRFIGILREAQAHKVCPAFLTFQIETSLVKKETIVEDILMSYKTGEVSLLLTDTQTKAVEKLLHTLKDLNPDGMSAEDLSVVFLLLFFVLTSTSSQPLKESVDPSEPKGGILFLVKLFSILGNLLEGRNFHSVLKLVHGGTLLQAAVSSLLQHSKSLRLQATDIPDWCDFIKAVQGFMRSLVQVIIIRGGSIRINLDQFASYVTSKEMESWLIAESSSGTSVLSVHFLLACLASFSQALTANLGRTKSMDQILTHILTKTTALMGPVVESILKPRNIREKVSQTTSILSQAFIVQVAMAMLQNELSLLSVEDENKRTEALTHMSLYQGFYQQILREINSAPRPMDFLRSSLQFLSTFYKAVEKMEEKREKEEEEEKKGGKELEELFIQILQNVQRLLTAPWLSLTDISELEPAVQDLLGCLVKKSSTTQFNVLLMMVVDGLSMRKLRAGHCREVLSTVNIIKLLSCCPLPETCSKALWLTAPQMISALMVFIRSSSQDVSLMLPFTIPMVMSLTSLLRQGEGNITNPHHVSLVFGALQAVSLDHLTPQVYQSAFLAVHEALFTIIQCYPQVMLNAAPSFLNVFYRLVASVMQEGRQRGESDTGPYCEVYLQCSRLVQRMYSHIAVTAESFTALSVFIVAQYITELQKVTLRPDVKQHLTEGIYQILDLCKEHDIKFLKAGLQMGVTEVFNELYSNYTYYHKAQRHGEDKYTV
ncbi:unhealthy ribosome biogenesis protein 2 homolog [Pholidichthys leucotaenia]